MGRLRRRRNTIRVGFAPSGHEIAHPLRQRIGKALHRMTTMTARSNAPITAIGVALAIAASGALAGCSKTGDGVDLSTYATTIEPADVLYNQALANLKTGRLKEASRKFASVDRQHPYSEFARRSLVMGAFTQYRRGQYDEAVGQANRYLALYPASEDAAYAQYIVGLSHYRQIADVTRDQRAARETVRAMSAVMEQYPDSEYVEDAQIKMLAARDQMAGK